MSKIKNLILDLGGVVLDIYFSKTKKAFEVLDVTDFDAFFSQYHTSSLFENLQIIMMPFAQRQIFQHKMLQILKPGVN